MTPTANGRGATRIHTLAVVVPARNEELRLPGCLEALAAATRHLQEVEPHPPLVRVVVVLDRCVDHSGDVVARWDAVEAVHSNVGRVGAARDAGVRHVLDGARGGTAAAGLPGRTREAGVWIASTDADSVVPPDWLSFHLRHARAGAGLLLGTVRLDPAGFGTDQLEPAPLRAWRERHSTEDGHSHVHGANLGIRGDIYRRTGGFPDVALHEDVLLSRSAQAVGARIVRAGGAAVRTSARTKGRTPAGMAGYLRGLIDDVRRLEADAAERTS